MTLSRYRAERSVAGSSEEPRARRLRGFTIVELVVATCIATILIGGVMAAFVEGMQVWQAEEIVAELHNNLELSMERIRRDMRLSSVGIGLMSFYPTNSTDYTAISIPLSKDSDGDGLLDRDKDDNIIWTHTVVYHVRPGSPDQLLRTVFTPRYSNSTPATIYAQLVKTVQSTSMVDLASACMTGESVTSKVIFENLVDLKFKPPESSFDCYGSAVTKGETFDWGSVVLSSGMHDLTFRVTGKNAASSGYVFEIDRFSMSWSGSWREGEVYLPTNSHPTFSPCYGYVASNGSVTAVERDSSTWNGGAALVFSATGSGASITFKVQNDLWCDNVFNSPGGTMASNTSAKFDTSFRAYNPFVADCSLSMDKGTAWSASSCGDDATYTFTNDVQVKVIVYGGTNQPDMKIVRNGSAVRALFFKPTASGVRIANVAITDPSTGASKPLLFGGSSDVTIPPGPTIWGTSWQFDWDIDAEKNYEVTYELYPFAMGATNGMDAWTNSAGIILGGIGPIGGGYVPTNMVVGLAQLDVGYPEVGLYRSGIYDTQLETPTYRYIRWTDKYRKPEGDVDIRIRSGSKPDLSDTTEADWTIAKATVSGYFQGGTAESLAFLPKKRYVQYEAMFQCDYDFQSGVRNTAPWAHLAGVPDVICQDVTIEWDGPPGLVDLITEITKRPDGPTIVATVDGKSLVKGVSVSMEIFKRSRKKLESVSGIIEVTPLNTGR